MKISLQSPRFDPQVSPVYLDLCKSQEGEAPERDWTEIRIVVGLDDVYTPGTRIEYGPFLVQLVTEKCQRLHNVLGRFARKGNKRPGTLNFTALGIVGHRHTLPCGTCHSKKRPGSESKVTRDGQETPFR